jgi:hypothetical protein
VQKGQKGDIDKINISNNGKKIKENNEVSTEVVTTSCLLRYNAA